MNHFLSLLLVQTFIRLGLARTLQADVRALQDFYDLANGPGWLFLNRTANWTFTRTSKGQYGNDPCNEHWDFIKCTKVGNYDRVSKLSITVDISLMTNEFPVALCGLSKLEQLELKSNIINSQLPTSLPGSCFSSLTVLDLSSNRLFGPMGTFIGTLSRLVKLALHENSLTGTIPENIYSLRSLQFLSLGGNSLAGSLSSSIGNMSSLTALVLEINSFSGTLPLEIGSLAQLKAITFSGNRFSGSLPAGLANSNNILKIWGWYNQLTGQIPRGFRYINDIDLSYNLLTGTVPATLGCESLALDNVKVNFRNNSLRVIEPGLFSSHNGGVAALDLSYNKITGRLPLGFDAINFSICDLSHNEITGPWAGLFTDKPSLIQLTISSNLFTGILGHDFSDKMDLEKLNLDSNLLSGSLSSSMSTLSKLSDLTLSNNAITGSIPKELSLLSNLQTLLLDGNALTGSLPSTLPSSLTKLALSFNAITGCIPQNIILLTNITSLAISSNRLTGHPPVLSGMSSLSDLKLGQNSLEGNLHDFLSPVLSQLSVLDVSSNLFTGHLPDFPVNSALETLVASSNCFSGSISETLCASKALSTLALDALAAGSNCRIRIWEHYADSAFVSKSIISGTIPDCLFSLPTIKILHVAGNGLGGSIAHNLSPSLTNLVVSWNKLTNTIPERVQRDMSQFVVFDVSNNEISGTVESMRQIQSEARVILSNNQISGELSADLIQSRGVDVLRGNLIDCPQQCPLLSRDDCLPSHDPYIANYNCGSSLVDTPLYIFAGLSCLILVLVLIRFPSVSFDVSKSLASTRFVSDLVAQARNGTEAGVGVSVGSYLLLLANVEKIILFLSASTLSLILLYGLTSLTYSTFLRQYSWTVSAVFKSGTTVAALFTIIWSLLIFLCVLALKAIFHHRDVVDPAGPNISSEISSCSMSVRLYLRSASILFLNVVTVTLANVGYLYANRSDTLTQGVSKFAISLFLFVWNGTVIPLLLQHFWKFFGISEAVGITDAQNANYFSLHLLMLIFNRIIAPCISIAFTSSSCFSYMLASPPFVPIVYMEQTCTTRFIPTELVFWQNVSFLPSYISNSETCSDRALSAGFLVPFAYCFACIAALLQNYAPVVVISAIMELAIVFLASPTLHLVVALFGNQSYLSKSAKRLLSNLKDDMTEHDWQEWVDSRLLNRNTQRDTLRLQKLLLDSLLGMILILTFGILFPLLCFPLVAILLVKIGRRRRTILFLLSFRAGHGGIELAALLENECAALLRGRAMYGAKRLFLVLPAFFLGLVVVDVVGQTESLRSAFWWPVIMMLSPALLYNATPAALTQRISSFFQREVIEAPSLGLVYMTNPLRISCTSPREENRVKRLPIDEIPSS